MNSFINAFKNFIEFMRKLMWVILHRKTIWIGKPISIYTLLLFVFVNILFVILIKTKFSASTFPESWKHRKKSKRSFCKNNICCLIFKFFPKRLVVNRSELLRYFNFEPGFKLRFCRTRDLLGSQIPVTTGGFELRIFCIKSRYLNQAIRPNKLGGFGVPEFATLRQ